MHDTVKVQSVVTYVITSGDHWPYEWKGRIYEGLGVSHIEEIRPVSELPDLEARKIEIDERLEAQAEATLASLLND